MIKLEIGGGIKPRGEGYLNLDLTEAADIIFNLDTIPSGGKLPFEDESVEAVYSSHCFEHLLDPLLVLREVARVCVVGAPVEIRCPHPLSDLAMVSGHRSVLSPICMKNWTHYFHETDFPRTTCPRRLRIDRIEVSPSELIDEIQKLYPRWSREQLMEFAPRAAHDYRIISWWSLTMMPDLPSSVRVCDRFASPEELHELSLQWPGPEWAGWFYYPNGKGASNARAPLPPVASLLLHRMSQEQPAPSRAVPDLGLWGAGLHATPNGSGLGLHLDAGRHALLGLERVYTSILYVHPEWEQEWGGELLLPGLRIDPLPGRMILFDCRNTPHSVAPLEFPGEATGGRRSLTLFWYGPPATDPLLSERATFFPPTKVVVDE